MGNKGQSVLDALQVIGGAVVIIMLIAAAVHISLEEDLIFPIPQFKEKDGWIEGWECQEYEEKIIETKWMGLPKEQSPPYFRERLDEQVKERGGVNFECNRIGEACLNLADTCDNPVEFCILAKYDVVEEECVKYIRVKKKVGE